MKKTVIIILAILPIFLMIAIAIAGATYGSNNPPSPTRVVFLDRLDNEYAQDAVLNVEFGEVAQVGYRIYPLTATDGVTFRSLEESVCTIDETGKITAVGSGTAIVEVETVEGRKTAKLTVQVKASYPIGVSLSDSSVELVEGATHQLTATVDTPDAKNREVTFTSDNPEVASVDVNGKIVTHSTGVAKITVETKKDPKGNSHTAECIVTVVEGDLPLEFDFTEAEEIQYRGTNGGVHNYLSSVAVINLMDYVRVSDDYSADDVEFRIAEGVGSCTLEDGVLTITASFTPIKIVARVGNEAPVEISIALINYD